MPSGGLGRLVVDDEHIARTLVAYANVPVGACHERHLVPVSVCGKVTLRRQASCRCCWLSDVRDRKGSPLELRALPILHIQARRAA